MNIVVKAPEVPAITVFFIAMATTTPSPGLEMEPCEEPLNARNPKIRINPPRAANYNAIIDYINGRGFSKLQELVTNPFEICLLQFINYIHVVYKFKDEMSEECHVIS
jgi:hypothetical protein